MTRRVFYSFHYKPDGWRAGKVRNIGVVEGNQSAKDNDWEAIKKGGDTAIQKWIDEQLAGRSCTIVLIGANTAGRKWINYEIKKSWSDEKGMLGIYIHDLTDKDEKQSSKGRNPFDDVPLQGSTKLSSVVKVYDPPYKVSADVRNHIAANLSAWIEEAIRIRQNH